MKKRLDIMMVEQGLAPSREKAKAYIMAGEVYVNGQKEDKAGSMFAETAKLEVRGKTLPYVSRGGLKLEKAMKNFGVTLKDKVCMDVGASTGGFTDCMLQNGAVKVYSIDVGYGQLDWKLRNDPRVVCMEKTNIRYVVPEDLEGPAAFSSIDVSFISLTKVLLPVRNLLTEDGEIVCLIKPQFEAGREKVGKKGVVRDPKVHEEVIEKVRDYAMSISMEPCHLSFSPIKGPEGNIEYLLHLKKHPEGTEVPMSLDISVEDVVKEAHGARCHVQKITEKMEGPYHYTDPDGIPEDTQCIIVLGGDGTLLQAARDVVHLDIPLLGINLGTLGFLAEVDKNSVYPALDRLLTDDYELEERMMLEGKIYRGDELVGKDIALNDIVIGREGHLRVIRFKNYVNDSYMNSYNADGIIISTPTGSTGYSLSAGGPVVSPSASMMIMTPIAPHTMNTRSIILSGEEAVTVEIGEGRHNTIEKAVASFDGDTQISMVTGDRIVIRKATVRTKILKLNHLSFVEVLRQKMSNS